MRLTLSLFAFFTGILFAQTPWNGTSVDSAWYTSAKNATTYTISTAAQLAGLAAVVNRGTAFTGKTINLAANIDLGRHEWTPIGGTDNPSSFGAYYQFQGIFDGQSNVISNLLISNNRIYAGLFGYVGVGEIRNIGVEALEISIANGPSKVYSGGLVGYAGNAVTITNGYSTGNISVASTKDKSSVYSGGLVGSGGRAIDSYSTCNVSAVANDPSSRGDVVSSGGLMGSGTATNSYATGNVSATSGSGDVAYSGGLVGRGSATNSYATGNVSATGGEAYSGGLMGSAGTATNSYATGNVSITGGTSGNTLYSGGLVGLLAGSGSITNSYASGDVFSIYYGGGLVGLLKGSSSITNSYASGNVSAYIAGGLVGFADTTISGVLAANIAYPSISYSYSTGNVFGSNTSGGLLGFTKTGSTINYSYYDRTTSSQSDAGKGIPKTTQEMKTQSTYENWDFTDTWIIDPSVHGGYPVLQYLLDVKRQKLIVDLQIYIAGQRLLNGYIPTFISPNTGSPVEPVVDSVIFNGIKLIAGRDYEVLYFNNTKVSTAAEPAKITIVGKGEYHGQKNFKFYIVNKIYMFNCTVDSIPKHTWNIEPKPVVKTTINGDVITLLENTDYTLSYTRNIDAGTATVTITGTGDIVTGSRIENYVITNILKEATIAASDLTYNGAERTPKVTVTHNPNGTLIEGIDYEIERYSNNINAGTGTVYVKGIGNYAGTISKTFTINKAQGTCSVTMEDFTTGGTPSKPEASSSTNTGVTPTYWFNGVNIVYSNANSPTAAGTYTVTATFPTTANYLQCEKTSEPFTIKTAAATDITVAWSKDSVFTYNKMVQAPTPYVEYEGKEIELMLMSAQAAAGKYEGQLAAMAIIKDEETRRKFNLKNNTKNYEIIKKDLKPYFATNLPSFEINTGKDTLKVPTEVFTDSDALKKILANIIAYDGFATDTVTNQSDDISVFKGKTPKIEFEYSQFLAKRVETTQKATATIVTDEIQPDNYALTRPKITIIEIIDDEAAEPIFCNRGAYCTELNAEVCSFVGGTAMRTCDAIRVSCIIDLSCVSNMLQAACINIGGTPITETCAIMTPIMSHTPFPISNAPTYYNLKGKPLGTVKPTTPGIYIEKAGRNAKMIIVK